MNSAVLVAIVTAAGGLVSGFLAFWNTRRSQQAQHTADTTRQQIETARVQIEEWRALVDSYRAEVDRLRGIIAEQDEEAR